MSAELRTFRSATDEERQLARQAVGVLAEIQEVCFGIADGERRITEIESKTLRILAGIPAVLARPREQIIDCAVGASPIKGGGQ